MSVVRNVAHTVAGWVAALLPDAAARAVWWLIAALTGSFVFLGPIINAAILYAGYNIRFLYSWPRLLMANAVTVAIALGILLILLRRHRGGPVSLGSLLGYSALIAVIIAFGRLIFVVPLQLGPKESGIGYFAVSASIVFLLFGVMAIAAWYAHVREEALADSFAELNRSRQALMHEEESVRSAVFDQLHGTAQSEIVAIRMQVREMLQDNDVTTYELQAIDDRLGALYRDSIQAVVRALAPQGLDVGLLPALRELKVRVEGAATVDLMIDGVVRTMDDPAAEGLNMPVRTAAFRIVEEAVSNALRHSGAREIEISVGSRLATEGMFLMLDVRHPVEREVVIDEGEGLHRMAVRAEVVGGEVGWFCEGGEFAVVAQLPITRTSNSTALRLSANQ